MRKKIIVPIVLAALFLGIFLFFRFTGTGQEFLWGVSDGGKLLLPLIAVAAVIDSINPCAFSVLILTIAFLFSIGKLRSGILKIGGAYVAGLFVVYVMIGLGILRALHLFNTPNFMAKVGAVLLIVLGAINIINEFFPRFPIKLKIPGAVHHKIAELMEKASVPTAFVLGALVGLCEFPCTGGPYLMVLGLLHDSATYAAGLGYLLLYNLIFILPLVIILLIASNDALLEKVQNWQREERKEMRLGGGIAMILLGFLIFLI
ncbi:MAG: cytochrome c biogenesis protein CcdA [Candidatus Jorgensenbacteria bacterium]